MYEDPKPFASLGSALLARKGGAKPAMRPQLSPLLAGAQAPGIDESDLDDLGWNDMGGDDAPSSTNLTRMTAQPYEPESYDFEDEEEGEEDDASYGSLLAPAPAEGVPTHAVKAVVPAAAQPSEPVEDVQTRFEEAVEALAAEARAEPEIRRQQLQLSAAMAREKGSPAPRRKAAEDGRRAAFTLRLDAQRHLKLRLASTVRNRSAQQLVTQALDQFLAGIPEIDALAAQVKRA